jgi:hypothetical protein
MSPDMEATLGDEAYETDRAIADTLAADVFHLCVRLNRNRSRLPFAAWAHADSVCREAALLVEACK